MMTGSEFLARLKDRWPDLRQSYNHPTNYIGIVDPAFKGTEEENEKVVAEAVGLSADQFLDLCDRMSFRFYLGTSEDDVELPGSQGQYWVRELVERATTDVPEGSPRVVHFYGYKGGQGRSTVLAFLGKVLAEDGWRVLMLDMDAEAPSLDILSGPRASRISNSVIGLRAEVNITPLLAHLPRSSGGHLHVLPFRPDGEAFDLDAAALAQDAATWPASQERMATALKPLLRHYDILLVDHRTGLSATVLPWLHTLPGPVVAFARMDGQARDAGRIFRVLWNKVGGNGVLVTALPADWTPERAQEEFWEEAEPILGQLAAARSDTLNASDVRTHWLLWPYDHGFVRGRTPDPERVGGGSRELVSLLRQRLALGEDKTPKTKPKRTLSDDFLHVPAWDRVQASSFGHLVLGMPGTGKSRFALELVRNGWEAILLPPELQTDRGLPINDPLLEELPFDDKTWWTLLASVLSTTSNGRDELRAHLRKGESDAETEVRKWATEATQPRSFVIAGLDHRFPALKLNPPLQSLFSVLKAVTKCLEERDAESLFRVVVMIPSNRAHRSLEGENHTHLKWDSRAILHYLLFRLLQTPRVAEWFPEATDALRQHRPALLEFQLEDQQIDNLLGRFFPSEVAKLPLGTFVRTWFNDDPLDPAGYLPVVMDSFVEALSAQPKPLSAGPTRVFSEAAILAAHHASAERYLEVVLSPIQRLLEVSGGAYNFLTFKPALYGLTVPFSAQDWAANPNLAIKGDLRKQEGLLGDFVTFGLFQKVGDKYDAGRMVRTALGLKQAPAPKPKTAAPKADSGLGGLLALGALALGFAALAGSDDPPKGKR
jgi:Mrp family chromosome partitioning ATPase